jgi:hypothetical protein
MSTEKDWLPRNHEALYNQANQTWGYFTGGANRDRMGFAPQTPLGQWFDTECDPKYNDFISAFTNWQNPADRTPTKIIKLTEAEKGFKPAYRKLYTGFLKESPLVSDDDLFSMGLPKRNTSRKPSPIASKAPNVDVDSSVSAHLTFHFYEKEGNHKRAKPEGQHGAEIAWLISDVPPTKWEELVSSNFDTRSPFTLSFENDQRGKSLYYALRWENTRGEKGPWSEIAYAIIP